MIHSTKIFGNFGSRLNGSVWSNQKSFNKYHPPFKVDHFSRLDPSDWNRLCHLTIPLCSVFSMYNMEAGLDTYFWQNLPQWKVCLKIYFPCLNISFPELKKAYILLANITNKLSSKFMSSHIPFFFIFFWWHWLFLVCSFLIPGHNFIANVQMDQNDIEIAPAVGRRQMKAQLAMNTKNHTPGQTHTDLVDTFLVFWKGILFV